MTDLVWIVSSCVMILAVVALRAIFGKKMSAGFRYALWALVALRLLIPGTFFKSPVSIKTAVMKTEVAENMESVKDFSSVELSGENEAIARPRYNRPAVNPANNAAANTETKPENTSSQIPAAEEKPAETAPKVTVIKNVTPERVKTYQKTIKARDILNVVWITGMALMAAYMLYVNIRLYLKLRERRVRLETDAPCRVYSVDGIESSCLFFNTVYVSKESAEDPEKLKCVLAHELSHRRHGDGFINLLRSAALVLHWYNPLVWYAAFASRQDSELFADAGAVKTLGEAKRQNYGMTLIELSTKPSVRASIACTATTMANNKRSVKERVKNVAARRRTTVLIGVLVLAFAAVAAGSAFLGSAIAENRHNADANAVKTTPEPTEPTAQPTTAPTQPAYLEPTDEWFYDEAWKTASEVVKLYYLESLELNRNELRSIDRHRDDPYSAGENDYTDVIFGSGEYGFANVTVRFIRDSAEASGWKAAKWMFRTTGGEDYAKSAADREAFGSSFHYIVTPQELAIAGYEVKGDDSDVEAAARYILNRMARKFVNLSNSSVLYCRDAQPGGMSLKLSYDDNGQRCKYNSCIAVLPRDPRSFELGFINAMLEWLYTGDEHPECRYYMQLYAELDAGRLPDGTIEVFAEIPENESSDAPSGLIDSAWAIAKKLGKVHDQQFDKEGAVIEPGLFSTVVRFPSVTFPGEMLVINVEKNEDGYYSADSWSVYIEPAEWAADELHAQYGPEVISAKHDELANARITVTADELRASGCGAEIGSDEYKAAAAALYGEKLAEYYRGNLTADTPFCCYDARFVCTQESVIHQDSYDVVIAFRIRDILPFSYLFSYGLNYCDMTCYPGYEGWLVGSTLVQVELAADGSFTCDAYLNGAG